MMPDSVYLKRETVEFCDASITLFGSNNSFGPSQELLQLFHNHSHFEIHVCMNDEFKIAISSKEIILKKNEMLVIPPGKYHYTAPLISSSGILILAFSVQQIPSREKLFGEIINHLEAISTTPFRLSDSLIEQLVKFKTSVAETLYELSEMKVETYRMMLNLFNEIGVFKHPIESNPTYRNPNDDMLMLERFINARLYNLATISEILGYSVKQVQRMIKKNYGMSYRELHKKMLHEDIKKLLSDYPDMPLSTVASLCGFTSTTAFYKTFKQLEGCSPREYKDKYRKNDDSLPVSDEQE